MEKNVIISIHGLQTYDGQDDDNIELVTEGILETFPDSDSLRLSYEETELTGMEGTTTVLEVEGKTVTLLRIGQVSSEMVFERGKRHMSIYKTPFGNLEIGVTARRMSSTLQPTGGKLEINYDIEVNNMIMSKSLLRVDVRESGEVKS